MDASNHDFSPDWQLIEDPVGDGQSRESYFGIEGGIGLFDGKNPQGFRITGWMKRADAKLMASALKLCESLDELLTANQAIMRASAGSEVDAAIDNQETAEKKAEPSRPSTECSMSKIKLATSTALALAVALPLAFSSPDALAKGGFSSSAGSGSRGGYSSAPSRSSSSPSYSQSAPRTTTTTRTTTVNRSYYRSGGGYGGGYRGGYYYHPMMMYPGFGMGYGYSNGLVEGLIIGNLMHPQGTTVYSGGGYNGSALLYPDGPVVNQDGYQVGNYANGQFGPVQNGPMVAQQAPPVEQAAPAAPAPAPVIVERTGPDPWDIIGLILLCLLGIGLLCLFVRWIMSWDYWDQESERETEIITETTVTTETASASPIVTGDLKRKREKGQFYVIDPSDKSKTWVNDHDDMYEDAEGRVWRLT